MSLVRKVTMGAARDSMVVRNRSVEKLLIGLTDGDIL
jgi:hypothetical protein